MPTCSHCGQPLEVFHFAPAAPPLGHLLDAQTDELGQSRFQVFEMSHLMALATTCAFTPRYTPGPVNCQPSSPLAPPRPRHPRRGQTGLGARASLNLDGRSPRRGRVAREIATAQAAIAAPLLEGATRNRPARKAATDLYSWRPHASPRPIQGTYSDDAIWCTMV